MEANSCLLIFNCGSSGLKFGVFEQGSLKSLVKGTVTGIGSAEAVLEVACCTDKLPEEISLPLKNFDKAAGAILEWLSYRALYYPICAIAHRIVHGGPEHFEPERLTAKLLDELKHYSYLAPLHLPNEIRVIEHCQKAFTHLPQFLCFDTAFHQDLPAVSATYALPKRFRKAGLRRYGFHGLSCEYVMKQLEQSDSTFEKKKIIIAHLGNGCSLTAVRSACSFDTTMGMSPTGGVVMSTRSGDLDPGVVLFLMRKFSLNAIQLDHLLAEESGLKAIAGEADVRLLLEKEASHPDAALAVQIFCTSIAKNIAALAASMGGLDLLVFTGGIGEKAAVIRARICSRLRFLKLELNPHKNETSLSRISKRGSRVKVCIIPTDEARMIAVHTNEMLIQLNTQNDDNDIDQPGIKSLTQVLGSSQLSGSLSDLLAG